MQRSRAITMTTDDVEPVAGPSHDNSHVRMTSRFHSSQQLTSVCLPVIVENLTYEDDEFYDVRDYEDGYGDDGVVGGGTGDDGSATADDCGRQLASSNSRASDAMSTVVSSQCYSTVPHHSASTSINVSDSTAV